jgi:hypothetical protein
VKALPSDLQSDPFGHSGISPLEEGSRDAGTRAHRAAGALGTSVAVDAPASSSQQFGFPVNKRLAGGRSVSTCAYGLGPAAGVEPATSRLQIRCSTVEPRWPLGPDEARSRAPKRGFPGPGGKWSEVWYGSIRSGQAPPQEIIGTSSFSGTTPWSWAQRAASWARYAAKAPDTCSIESPPNFSTKASARVRATMASPTTEAAGTEVTSER